MKIELELQISESPYSFNATVRSINEPASFDLIKDVVHEALYRLPLKSGSYEVSLEVTYGNSKEVQVDARILRTK